MRAYLQASEENIRDAGLVREWIESGLLQKSQQSSLDAGLGTNLRTLHLVFRVLLFAFSALILVAIVALIGIQMRVGDETGLGVLFGIFAVVCFGVAWVLAASMRFYRCGAEEAAAVLGVTFSGLAVGFLLEPYAARELLPLVGAVATAAAACFFVHAIFGFRYIGVVGVILGGAVPFMLDVGTVAERVLSALIYTGLFIGARHRAATLRHELRGLDYAWMQAFAWAGIYAALHQRLPWNGIGIETESAVFYWLTYVMIWILPAAGIRLGIRDRDRVLLDVSAVLALITLISNKPYLGWTRQAWDPILLGVFLIAIAALLRRWLVSGAKASRAGFTSDRLLGRETRYVEAAGVVSLAVQQPDVQLPKPHETGGGRSGGGGASGNF